MSVVGHSLPICWVSTSHDVRSTPEAEIRFQPNICRDGPQGDNAVQQSNGLLRYVLPNLRQQFARAVGLGHKVVAASLPRLLFFFIRRVRRDRDDRDR